MADEHPDLTEFEAANNCVLDEALFFGVNKLSTFPTHPSGSLGKRVVPEEAVDAVPHEVVDEEHYFITRQFIEGVDAEALRGTLLRMSGRYGVHVHSLHRQPWPTPIESEVEVFIISEEDARRLYEEIAPRLRAACDRALVTFSTADASMLGTDAEE